MNQNIQKNNITKKLEDSLLLKQILINSKLITLFSNLNIKFILNFLN